MRKIFTKFLCSIISVMLVLCTAACHNNNGTIPPIGDDENRPTVSNTKTLVVYFSQPDNVDDSTVEINGEILGNTQYMAYVIQENTGANIFRIVPETPYPTSHSELVDLAREEQRNSARPKFNGEIENFDSYENVFVGYPNWWSDMPMILYTFFDTYNFSGKTIIPFNTHGGSGFSSTINTIKNLEPDAAVKDGLSILRDRIQDAEQQIIDWVRSLGFEKTEQKPTVPDNNANEYTESLTFERSGDSYIVTGITEDVEDIIIPAKYEGLPVTTIGESAFAYSRHNGDIISVTIPDSVITIERNAFYNRSEMIKVNIGVNSQLQTIGNNAFSGNRSLQSIYIPSSVTAIGDSAFNNDGAIDFTVAGENAVYRSENGHLIERQTNTLIRGGQSEVVPDGVTAIAQAAFRRTIGISELSIPQSVTTIGNYFIADSKIETVKYAGTQDEWNNIEKSEKMWNYGNRDVNLVFEKDTAGENGNTLVVYFSWSSSGNTERMANHIAEQTGADIVRIEAAVPYTGSYNDIAYGRAKDEHDTNARPEVAAVTYDLIDMSKYDTVFVGYPIWWWTTPMVVATFLEHYTWNENINIYPFSQSASMDVSQFNTSMEQVRTSAVNAVVHEGLFVRVSDTSAIDNYLKTNGFLD